MLDAYVFQEVVNAVHAGYQGQAVSTFLTRFANIVNRCNTINGPQQQAVSQMNVARVRDMREVKVLAEVLDIQAKDAPIVCLAWEYAASSPTIYTHDKPFSSLSPTNHNLGAITVVHVPM